MKNNKDKAKLILKLISGQNIKKDRNVVKILVILMDNKIFPDSIMMQNHFSIEIKYLAIPTRLINVLIKW
jgi:hypothetical protein